MKIKEFYHEFEMLVRPSSRRLRRMKNPGYRSDVWNAYIDDAMIYDISNVAEEVECVEVLMPADRLEELEQLLEHYEKMEKEHQHRHVVISKLREDERVRIKNPAVRQAWEHYLTLLNLCRD